MLKSSTAFILSFVVSHSSKNLTRGLQNIGDVLIYRTGMLNYDIGIKYFRTLAFNVKVFRKFITSIIIIMQCFSKTVLIRF